MSNRSIYRFSWLAVFCGFVVSNISVAQAPKENVRDFVRGYYYHSLPIDQARRYGKESVPVLLDMLNDDRERKAWPNIVLMLGLMEDQRGVQPLINFLETRFRGSVDKTVYRTLVLVPNSLGMLATSTDTLAHRYLMNSLTQSSWRQRNLSWTYPALKEDETEAILSNQVIRKYGRKVLFNGRYPTLLKKERNYN